MQTVTQSEPGYSEPLNAIGRSWVLTFDSEGDFVLDVQMRVGGKWLDMFDHGNLITIDSTSGPKYVHVLSGFAYRMAVRECSAPVTMQGTETSAYAVV